MSENLRETKNEEKKLETKGNKEPKLFVLTSYKQKCRNFYSTKCRQDTRKDFLQTKLILQLCWESGIIASYWYLESDTILLTCIIIMSLNYIKKNLALNLACLYLLYSHKPEVR